MIEMLGVLAIIGVLSVGGIAGYSKAMMKFKINKTIDQISQVVLNVRTLYAQQKDFNGIGSTLEERKMLFPEEMFKNGKVTNEFGGEIRCFTTAKIQTYMLELKNIPKETCIELATKNWGSVTTTGFKANSINTTNSEVGNTSIISCSRLTTPGAAYSCVGSSDYPHPMPLASAAKACKESNNTLYWKYY